MRDATALVGVLVWPVTILVLAITFRGEIPRFIEAIATRVSRVSAGFITLELIVATPLKQDDFPTELREPSGSTVTSSGLISLQNMVTAGQRRDYAIFDLRQGRSWLTTRLYLFSVVLPRLLGVKCFVFVQDSPPIAGRFVGLAEPESVRNRLTSSRYWLAPAFQQAHLIAESFPVAAIKESAQKQLSDDQLRATAVSAAQSALVDPLWASPYDLERVANEFFKNSQIRRAKASSPDPAWVELTGAPPMEEHASWIENEIELKRLLGDVLLRPTLVKSPLLSNADLRAAVLDETSSYVALVDGSERFISLIDRSAVAEAAATGRP